MSEKQMDLKWFMKYDGAVDGDIKTTVWYDWQCADVLISFWRQNKCYNVRAGVVSGRPIPNKYDCEGNPVYYDTYTSEEQVDEFYNTFKRQAVISFSGK